MKRLRLWLLCVCVMVVCGACALAWRSVHAIEQEHAERHYAIAAQIEAVIDTVLDSFLTEEDARPFTHYRFLYVPDDQTAGSLGLSRSPLAAVQPRQGVAAWFQIDPDGSLHTPHEPDDMNQAVELGAWKPMMCALYPQVVLQDELAPLWDVLGVQEKQADMFAAVPEQQSKLEPHLNQQALVRKKSSKRELRSSKQIQASPVQAVQFSNSLDNRYNQFVMQNNDYDTLTETVPMKQGQALAQNMQEIAAQRQQASTSVTVSPLRSYQLASDRLVLVRSVETEDGLFHQGLLVHLSSFQEGLLKTIDLAPAIAERCSFYWGEYQSSEQDDVFVSRHQFAEPFTDIQLQVVIRSLPYSDRGGPEMVLWLTAIFITVFFCACFAVERSVATMYRFAQRRQDFVAAVSHELKTPLTSIRLYAEMLREGMVTDRNKQQEYYETIHGESERLSRLIGNVLEFAQLERGQQTGALHVGSVTPVLENALQIMQQPLRAAGFTVEQRIENEVPSCTFDTDALTQILVNVIDNAIKFSKESAEKRLIVSVTAQGKNGVILSVRDCGPGVPQEHLSSVFEAFYRGERELTRRTKGTGIGLALVQSLMQRMGGACTAQNHPEGGFELQLTLL